MMMATTSGTQNCQVENVAFFEASDIHSMKAVTLRVMRTAPR